MYKVPFPELICFGCYFSQLYSVLFYSRLVSKDSRKAQEGGYDGIRKHLPFLASFVCSLQNSIKKQALCLLWAAGEMCVCSALGKRYSPHCYLRDRSANNKLIHIFKSMCLASILQHNSWGWWASPIIWLTKTSLHFRTYAHHISVACNMVHAKCIMLIYI